MENKELHERVMEIGAKIGALPSTGMIEAGRVLAITGEMLRILEAAVDLANEQTSFTNRMLDVNEKMRGQHCRLIEQNRSLGYLAAMHLNHTTRANA